MADQEFSAEDLAAIADARRRMSGDSPPPATPSDSRPNTVLNFLSNFNPPPGLIGGTVGGISGAALGASAGGIGAIPGATIGAALGGAGEENLRQMFAGKFAPGQVGIEGAKSGAMQLIGEGLLAPFRYALNAARLSKATKTATDAFELAKGQRTGTIAANESTAATKTAADQSAFQTELAATKAKNTAGQEAYASDLATTSAKNAEAKSTYANDLATAKAGTLQDKAKYAEQVSNIGATHAAAMTQWQERGADTVTSAWKNAVPSWSEFPGGIKGILEMVYGQGQQKLGAMFDKAMTEVEKAGTGRLLTLPQDVVNTLNGLPKGTNAVAEAEKKLGGSLKVIPQGVVGSVSGKYDLIAVDAGQLAKAAVGFWKKDRDVYKRVVQALDQAGLGNNAAREEYMNGQSIIQFIAENKIAEGGTYHADRVLSGLTTGLKSINALRNRGMGDVFRGPFAESLSGQPPVPGTPSFQGPMPTPPQAQVLPPPPATLPLPQRFTPGPLPQKPTPTLPLEAPPEIGPPPRLPYGYSTMTTPRVSPWVGGLAAEIPALLSGGITGGSPGFGEMGARSMIPFAGGAVAAAALSGRQFVTRAGRNPAVEALLHAFPTLAAQYAGAQYLRQTK